MCGIAGLLGVNFSDRSLHMLLEHMQHRGPDGQGTWIDSNAGIRLGHVRLSIIDLNTGGQPMHSADGRYVIVYNGELYNYLELKSDLEKDGFQFVTTSDTEVMLAGLSCYGPTFLDRTIGMFALALWDRSCRTLLVARDRMGIKPLYFAETRQGFAFASELKALLRLPGVSAELNQDALLAYFGLRYVPSPDTMVQGVRKLPAAHYFLFRDGLRTEKRWWNLRFESRPMESCRSSEERLDWLLTDAVKLCLRSDVPVGAFLSGGIDSGLIAALMAKHSSRAVNTYSIGFESTIDERVAAHAVAEAIGTNHFEFALAPADIRRLPEVVRALDEPFPDPIVLAMSLLAEKSRESVKVVLTGEGADELFGGYVHHPHLRFLDSLAAVVPSKILTLAGRLAASAPLSLVNRLISYTVPLARKDAQRIQALLENADNPIERYLAYISLFSRGDRERLFGTHETAMPRLISRVTDGLSSERDRSYMDKVWEIEHRYWLTDNILFKQDKTLMAFGVEGRVPFCDHRLVEFAATLPLSSRLGWRSNKVALRRAALRIAPMLPKASTKKAFMVPMDGVYGTEMRTLAGDILGSSEFRALRLFDQSVIDELLAQFPSPSLVAGKQLLAVLMFALWNREVRVEAKNSASASH